MSWDYTKNNSIYNFYNMFSTIMDKYNLITKIQLENNFDVKNFLDVISVEVIHQTFDDKNLIAALLKLSKIERIIIVFNIIMGMKQPEIATLLNIKIDNLYVRKYRAKKMLLKYIEDMEL